MLASALLDSAIAEDKMIPDCIATPLNKGASLMIDGKLTEVPEAGVRIKNCREAKFETASVKVRYVAPGNTPYVDFYSSTDGDRGKLISERISGNSSFQYFFNWRERMRPTPAGNYTGIISTDETLKGDFFIVTPFNRTIYNAVSPTVAARPTSHIVVIANDGSGATSEVLPDPCSRDLKFLSNCAQIFGSTTERLVLFAPRGPLAFAVGQDYLMKIDRKTNQRLASVSPEFLNAYLQALKAPKSSDADLDKMLAQYSFSVATGNPSEAVKTEKRLAADFPHLVEKDAVNPATGAPR